MKEKVVFWNILCQFYEELVWVPFSLSTEEKSVYYKFLTLCSLTMKGAISLIKKVWINPWKKGREIRSVLARWKNTFKKRIKTEKSYQTKEMMRHCYVLLYQYDSQQIYFMKFGSLLHFSPWQMNLQLNWRGSRFSTPNIQSLSVTDSFFFSLFGHRKKSLSSSSSFFSLDLDNKSCWPQREREKIGPQTEKRGKSLQQIWVP